MCTEFHMDTATPENTRETNESNTSPLRTTSSRYNLDKPKTTEESFSKNFQEAMSFLQSYN